jgi:ferredoxin
MKEIYPENARHALEVFQLYEGQGEYFDLSSKPIYRDTFTIGDKKEEQSQYVIDEKCIGCDECTKICPQQCIDRAAPYFIIQEKIEMAKYLLCDTNTNISEIAYQSGFNESHNFMKVFKKMVG